jgi:hypothetical protein
MMEKSRSVATPRRTFLMIELEPEEKEWLRRTARRQGFRTLSSWGRKLMLDQVRDEDRRDERKEP